MNNAQEPTEEDVDAVLTELDGDTPAAIRALLHDLTVLAADMSSVVSRGYVRGPVVLNVTRLPARKRTDNHG